MQTDKHRADKYGKKIRGLILPGQLSRFASTQAKQVEIENIVNTIVGSNINRVYYIIFGKEVYKLIGKHSDNILDDEIEILQNKWKARGLEEILLAKIKKAVGYVSGAVPIVILRPTADYDNYGWIANPPPVLYVNIDEAVTQPDPGDTDDMIMAQTPDAICEFLVQTLPAEAIVTGIKLWVYVKTLNPPEQELFEYYIIDAAYSEVVTIPVTADWTWQSAEWTGLNYAKEDIDKLRMGLYALIMGTNAVYVATAYFELTLA